MYDPVCIVDFTSARHTMALLSAWFKSTEKVHNHVCAVGLARVRRKIVLLVALGQVNI